MNQQQSGPDNSSVLLVIFIIFAVTWMLWHFQRQIFVYPICYMRLGEVNLIRYVLVVWGKFVSLLGFHAPDTLHFDGLRETIMGMLAAPKKVDLQKFEAMNSMVGEWIRYPFMLIMAVLGLYVYRKSTTLHYKTAYSMSAIKKAEVVNYPQITPVLNVNLVKQDLEKGPWARLL